MKKKINNFLTKAWLTIPGGLLDPKQSTVGKDYPKTLVNNLINYVLWFLGALAVVFVIYGGILYITSGGDADKTKKARDTLLYAIIGVIVVIMALVIVSWAASLGRSDLDSFYRAVPRFA